MNPTKPRECTHCGRVNCRDYGGEECQVARKEWFEEQRRTIELWAELKRRRVGAASGD